MGNNYEGPSFLQVIRDKVGTSFRDSLLYAGRPTVIPPIIVEESGASNSYDPQNMRMSSDVRRGRQNLTRKILSD